MRIRTRHDISWPLGWAAAALEVGFILMLIYAAVVDHAGDVSPDPASWVIAGRLWMAGAVAAVVTLGMALLTEPRGRGSGPALAALGIVLCTVLLFLRSDGRRWWLTARTAPSSRRRSVDPPGI